MRILAKILWLIGFAGTAILVGFAKGFFSVISGKDPTKKL